MTMEEPPDATLAPEIVLGGALRSDVKKPLLRFPRVGRQGRALYSATHRFLGVAIATITLSVLLTITQPAFFTVSNVSGILQSVAILFLVSVGETFVLVTGGFDLSVASVAALAGVLLGAAIGADANPWLGIGIAVATGAGIGLLFNGLLIGKLGLPFFVVTLGGMSLFQGIAFVYTSGMTTLIQDPTVAQFGSGNIAGFPIPIMLMMFVFVLALFMLHGTRFGRALYAVGGNREAARLSGINVTAVLVAVYGICGLLAGVAGVVEAGRLGAAAPTADPGLALTAAAAVLLGGTSFSGGNGGVGGTFVGVIFIGILENGLGLMGVSAFWKDIVTGAVLVTAVVIDRISRRDRG